MTVHTSSRTTLTVDISSGIPSPPNKRHTNRPSHPRTRGREKTDLNGTLHSSTGVYRPGLISSVLVFKRQKKSKENSGEGGTLCVTILSGRSSQYTPLLLFSRCNAGSSAFNVLFLFFTSLTISESKRISNWCMASNTINLKT